MLDLYCSPCLRGTGIISDRPGCLLDNILLELGGDGHHARGGAGGTQGRASSHGPGSQSRRGNSDGDHFVRRVKVLEVEKRDMSRIGKFEDWCSTVSYR